LSCIVAFAGTEGAAEYDEYGTRDQNIVCRGFLIQYGKDGSHEQRHHTDDEQ
jgi:hypothetical protein